MWHMHYNQKMWTFHLSFMAVTLIFHFTYTVDCTLPCVHGDCIHSYCQCDQYWQGNECDEGTLPSNNSLMDTLISIFINSAAWYCLFVSCVPSSMCQWRNLHNTSSLRVSFGMGWIPVWISKVGNSMYFKSYHVRLPNYMMYQYVFLGR